MRLSESRDEACFGYAEREQIRDGKAGSTISYHGALWLEILRDATNDEISKRLSFRACHEISCNGALWLEILSQAQNDREKKFVSIELFHRKE